MKILESHFRMQSDFAHSQVEKPWNLQFNGVDGFFSRTVFPSIIQKNGQPVEGPANA